MSTNKLNILTTTHDDLIDIITRLHELESDLATDVGISRTVEITFDNARENLTEILYTVQRLTKQRGNKHE